MSSPAPTVADLYQRLCHEPARQDVIDALLRAITAPFAPGETARGRVDALLPLVEDSVIGELRGSDQRRVDVTALHALLFMSSTHEQELSERGQELLQRFPLSSDQLAARRNWASIPTPTWQRIAAGVGVGWGFCEILSALTQTKELGFLSVTFPLGTLLTLILPGLRMTRPRQFLREGWVRVGFSMLLVLSAGLLALFLLGILFFTGGVSVLLKLWYRPLFLLGMGMGMRALVFVLLVWPRRATT